MDKNLQYIVFQRNTLFAVSLLMGISLVILSSFLFIKNERVIISPPIIEKEFWVESSMVSASYIEQYGRYLAQILLQKSAESAPGQRSTLLRHADPGFIGALKSKLLAEEEMLKKQNASYVFYPIEAKVSPDKLQISLSGERIFYVNGKKVSSENEGYILSFTFNGSRLLLSGISAVEKKQDG